MFRIHSASALLPLLLLVACGDKDPGTDTDGPTDDCEERSWFLDADGDGHGGDESASACEAPEGFVAQSTDCDDTDPAIHPEAVEVCDGADNDCDGDVDTGATDALTAFVDADGDGFGDDGSTVQVCEVGEGTAAEGGDCDDSADTVFPGAPEVCDGLDNDCDDATDGISVPGDHSTIGEAVDAAANGDLICVAAGDYPERVEISSKGVRLGGAGVGNTRITGPLLAVESLDYAVELYEADGTEISGMTIQGLSTYQTGGLSLQDIELSGVGCAISSCVGVGLMADNSVLDLTDVVITDNHITGSTSATQRLYGLAWFSTSDVTWTGGGIIDNTVSFQNSTVLGYGLLSASESTLVATDVEVAGNVVDLVGTGNSGAAVNFNGLLWTSLADLDFTDVTLHDNEITSTSYLSGVHASGTATAQANAWMNIGGGSLSWVGGGVVDNVNTNSGSEQANGLATYMGADPLVLEDVDFNGNAIYAYAQEDGAYAQCGGLYTNGSAVRMTRVNLRDNVIDCQGDQAYHYGLATHWNGTTTYENVVVAGNEVDSYYRLTGLVSLNYQGETPLLSNVTVVGNTTTASEAASGVLHATGGGVDVVNAAITNNGLTVSHSDDSEYPGAAVLYIEYAYDYSMNYSAIFGNSSTSSRGFMVGGTEHASQIWGHNGTYDMAPGYAEVVTQDAVGWDLSLADDSQLIDAGDPAILDVDGSTSDIGAYGGPEASW